MEVGGQLNDEEIDRLEMLASVRSLSGGAEGLGELLALQRAPVPEDAQDLYLQAADDDRGFLRYLLGQRQNLRVEYGNLPESTTDYGAIEGFQSAAREKLLPDQPALPAPAQAATGGVPTIPQDINLNRTERAVIDPANAGSLAAAFTTSRPSYETWFRTQLPRLKNTYARTNAAILSQFDNQASEDEPTRVRQIPTLYDLSRRR